MPDRPLHVLVVDDNEDDLFFVELAFARAGGGVRVTGAPGGREALSALGTGPRPDLVLLDWKMPGVTGADVLRATRANPALIGLPVAILTSSDDPSDRRTAFEAGATAYLTKPPELDGYVELARGIVCFWSRNLGLQGAS